MRPDQPAVITRAQEYAVLKLMMGETVRIGTSHGVYCDDEPVADLIFIQELERERQLRLGTCHRGVKGHTYRQV
jgi:hypothetical protein